MSKSVERRLAIQLGEMEPEELLDKFKWEVSSDGENYQFQAEILALMREAKAARAWAEIVDLRGGINWMKPLTEVMDTARNKSSS
jgi:hypothetical protein